ncbi:MAG: DUF1080 domain-containing protein [Planctomycetaceae bacterium]|jgi:hypothetical protein|nr:DUF1080 domain-containing protein [Planctomycetaceae bacterium]
MPSIFRSTVSIVFTLAACAAVLKADDAPGYTDAPQIPGSQWKMHDKNRPQPPNVIAGKGGIGITPPSDAVVLFDGKSLEKWNGKNLNAVQDGAFDIRKTGGLTTKESFGSFQLHIEWKTGTAKEERMHWGNSGVFLLGGAVEIQIIESRDSYIYADGNAGAVYGQAPPLVNPARKPGEWQSFDIVFDAPKIENGKQTKAAYVTVFYNGVLVQNNTEILGTTLHKTAPKPLTKETGSISLQEHGSSVQFKNIWLRKL